MTAPLDHAAPLVAIANVRRALPEALVPEKIFSVTEASSPGPVPAAPPKLGVGLFVGVVTAARDTAGDFVLIVNVVGVLTPVLPASSDCSACSV